MKAKAKANEMYDGKKIAEMVIPLTPKEARERNVRFGGDPEKAAKAYRWADRGHHFTCKNWDEETRLCTIYPDRPQMCRDFPYGKKCQFGCGYCGGVPTDERRKIREEQVTNQWKAYRAPEPGPKLA